jgi:hypothetical protein
MFTTGLTTMIVTGSNSFCKAPAYTTPRMASGNKRQRSPSIEPGSSHPSDAELSDFSNDPAVGKRMRRRNRETRARFAAQMEANRARLADPALAQAHAEQEAARNRALVAEAQAEEESPEEVHPLTGVVGRFGPPCKSRPEAFYPEARCRGKQDQILQTTIGPEERAYCWSGNCVSEEAVRGWLAEKSSVRYDTWDPRVGRWQGDLHTEQIGPDTRVPRHFRDPFGLRPLGFTWNQISAAKQLADENPMNGFDYPSTARDALVVAARNQAEQAEIERLQAIGTDSSSSSSSSSYVEPDRDLLRPLLNAVEEHWGNKVPNDDISYEIWERFRFWHPTVFETVPRINLNTQVPTSALYEFLVLCRDWYAANNAGPAGLVYRMMVDAIISYNCTALFTDIASPLETIAERVWPLARIRAFWVRVDALGSGGKYEGLPARTLRGNVLPNQPKFCYEIQDSEACKATKGCWTTPTMHPDLAPDFGWLLRPNAQCMSKGELWAAKDEFMRDTEAISDDLRGDVPREAYLEKVRQTLATWW